VGKEKKKEATLEIPVILVRGANAKEKSKEELIPSSSNSKGTAKNKQSTMKSKKDIPILVPFQVHQGFHKKKVHYNVISHLK